MRPITDKCAIMRAVTAHQRCTFRYLTVPKDRSPSWGRLHPVRQSRYLQNTSPSQSAMKRLPQPSVSLFAIITRLAEVPLTIGYPCHTVAFHNPPFSCQSQAFRERLGMDVALRVSSTPSALAHPRWPSCISSEPIFSNLNYSGASIAAMCYTLLSG
ncbi:hypothetical protein BR93DRAFT_928739 [Coniochaeta sp. PMI_546]|nr:hypothetical protein BR93DRAFT_928739 [Coniochaeta sp. PMI_546]